MKPKTKNKSILNDSIVIDIDSELPDTSNLNILLNENVICVDSTTDSKKSNGKRKSSAQKKAMKKTKEKRVTVRMTDREYKAICNQAKKEDVTVSNYIRDCIFSDKGKKTKTDDSAKIANVKAVVMATDILRYAEERYGSQEDETLRKKVKELWKILS